MSIELTIAIAGIIGLLVGLRINKAGIKERDKRIAELENELEQQVSQLKQELIVKQNVAEALNDTVQRLKKKLRNGETTDIGCGGRNSEREETEGRKGSMAARQSETVVSQPAETKTRRQ